jgi:hypothetical protein
MRGRAPAAHRCPLSCRVTGGGCPEVSDRRRFEWHGEPTVTGRTSGREDGTWSAGLSYRGGYGTLKRRTVQGRTRAEGTAPSSVVATPRRRRWSVGAVQRRREVRGYRGQTPSPGRPTVAWREDRVRFWAAIATARLAATPASMARNLSVGAGQQRGDVAVDGDDVGGAVQCSAVCPMAPRSCTRGWAMFRSATRPRRCRTAPARVIDPIGHDPGKRWLSWWTRTRVVRRSLRQRTPGQSPPDGRGPAAAGPPGRDAAPAGTPAPQPSRPHSSSSRPGCSPCPGRS